MDFSDHGSGFQNPQRKIPAAGRGHLSTEGTFWFASCKGARRPKDACLGSARPRRRSVKSHAFGVRSGTSWAVIYSDMHFVVLLWLRVLRVPSPLEEIGLELLLAKWLIYFAVQEVSEPSTPCMSGIGSSYLAEVCTLAFCRMVNTPEGVE